MALHELFRENDGKRAYFERAFEQWYDRTKVNLETLAANNEALALATNNLEVASAALPINEDAIEVARRQHIRAKNDVAFADPRHKSLSAAVEKVRSDEPDQGDVLATILRIREDISNKVANLDISNEKHYGPQNGLITMNANLHLNGLSDKDQAQLFEYFNLVQELSVDAPNIIILADKIAQREAQASLIGPKLPEAGDDGQRVALG